MPRRWFKRRHPMNVTLSGIEELDLFPSEEEREAAIKWHADSVKGWSLFFGIAICGLIAIGTLFVSRAIIIPGISKLLPWGLPPWAREPLQFAFVAVVMFLSIRMLHRWGVRRDLRKKLLALGVPVCMGCGYLLRGLRVESERCPECGREFDETVRAILRQTTNEPNDRASS